MKSLLKQAKQSPVAIRMVARTIYSRAEFHNPRLTSERNRGARHHRLCSIFGSQIGSRPQSATEGDDQGEVISQFVE
jgi:hypothetical protein